MVIVIIKKKYPFFKLFYAGGINSIRGFSERSIGPKDSQGKTCGGNILLSSRINLILPDLLDKNFYRNSTIIFFDFAQIYNNIDNKIYNNSLKCTIGLSFECYSPLGPLMFNLATPINYKRNDQIQFFTFNLGTYI